VFRAPPPVNSTGNRLWLGNPLGDRFRAARLSKRELCADPRHSDWNWGFSDSTITPYSLEEVDRPMRKWLIEELAWSKFDREKVDPDLVPLIKAAALVERNSRDYAFYLGRVFHDDPAFREAANNWAEEEVQHGEALGRWASLADVEWDFSAAYERYRAGYQLPLDAETSVRGSRAGELIARCMVETGTSNYYTALSEATEEPVLRQICKRIAADEFRHYKLFYDHLRRYLARDRIGAVGRLRIALRRIGESEDDELAFAWHCANEPKSVVFERRRCTASYGATAMRCYKPRHVDRMIGMLLKVVGLPARGRLSTMATWLAWRTIQWRRRRYIGAIKSPATIGSSSPSPATP
jgi:hypothetical protein